MDAPIILIVEYVPRKLIMRAKPLKNRFLLYLYSILAILPEVGNTEAEMGNHSNTIYKLVIKSMIIKSNAIKLIVAPLRVT